MPAPFADYKTIAVFVERTAGMFRVGIAGRERSHGGEATHAHGCNCCLSTARNDHVGIVALDGAKGVAHRMRTGGAGRRCCLVRAQRSIADADLAGCQVGNGAGNKKW